MLIVVASPTRRASLVAVCRAAGLRVRGVGSVAELEQWPDRETVIVDAAYLTPLWHELGAVDVIAHVDTAEEGFSALGRGASHWLPLDSSVAEITAAVGSPSFDTGNSRTSRANLPKKALAGATG